MTSLTEDGKMGETTILTKATSKSESLRTTVPAGIVRQFGIKEGDTLNWSIEVKGNKLMIAVTHIRQETIVKGKLRKQGTLP